MSRLSRRQFGSTAAAALFVPAANQAQEGRPRNANSVIADALLEIVKLRYGKQLDAEKLAAVRASLLSNLQSAERIHREATTDEPAFTFSAEIP